MILMPPPTRWKACVSAHMFVLKGCVYFETLTGRLGDRFKLSFDFFSS